MTARAEYIDHLASLARAGEAETLAELILAHIRGEGAVIDGIASPGPAPTDLGHNDILYAVGDETEEDPEATRTLRRAVAALIRDRVLAASVTFDRDLTESLARLAASLDLADDHDLTSTLREHYWRSILDNYFIYHLSHKDADGCRALMHLGLALLPPEGVAFPSLCLAASVIYYSILDDSESSFSSEVDLPLLSKIAFLTDPEIHAQISLTDQKKCQRIA